MEIICSRLMFVSATSPVALCMYKVLCHHNDRSPGRQESNYNKEDLIPPILTIVFKNVLRTFEDETLKVLEKITALDVLIQRGVFSAPRLKIWFLKQDLNGHISGFSQVKVSNCVLVVHFSCPKVY